MRPAPLLVLLALGCSETPASTTDAQVAPDLCVCQDGTVPPDVVVPEDRADVVTPDVVDAPAPVDAPDVQLADVVDAAVGADVVDAGADDVLGLDVATDAMDAAGLDATVVDAPDVQLADVVDVATDRPDVVDVPQDAGPVLYDLNAVRSAFAARAVYRRYLGAETYDDDRDANLSMSTCYVESGTIHFGIVAGATFTGLIPLAGTSGRVVTITPGAPAATNDVAPVVVAGTPQGTRQSFRLGVAAPPVGATRGVSGAAGRTVDPMRGDLWLLGCELR